MVKKIYLYYKENGFLSSIVKAIFLVKGAFNYIFAHKPINISFDYDDFRHFEGTHITQRERISDKDSLTELHMHLLPYFYILPYIENKRVLDLGCGYGYGASLLKGKADKVFAIDKDADIIEVARKKYEKQRIEFLVHDVNEKLPFKNDFFDAVICSEVIEHIKNFKIAILEVNRVLREKGTLFLKTPNASLSLGDCHYHSTEFTKYKLYKLLRPCFSKIKIYGFDNNKITYRYKKINNDEAERAMKDYKFGEKFPLCYKFEVEAFCNPFIDKKERKTHNYFSLFAECTK